MGRQRCLHPFSAHTGPSQSVGRISRSGEYSDNTVLSAGPSEISLAAAARMCAYVVTPKPPRIRSARGTGTIIEDDDALGPRLVQPWRWEGDGHAVSTVLDRPYGLAAALAQRLRPSNSSISCCPVMDGHQCLDAPRRPPTGQRVIVLFNPAIPGIGTRVGVALGRFQLTISRQAVRVCRSAGPQYWPGCARFPRAAQPLAARRAGLGWNAVRPAPRSRCPELDLPPREFRLAAAS